ncbi:PPC domain-containing protein [Artemisia annua]|uniref:AT-hook motif nuclear-localized protein n=1 Tax=Artemisia annua TaxID=35608 RepID=A0A2U1PH33_ARTAN|nr:PPC domain-containing protein [Artemisia annua]
MEFKENNQTHDSGSVSVQPPATVTTVTTSTAAVVVSGVEYSGGLTVAPPPGFKKKRGRPKKSDLERNPAATLSPMPISASIPISGDFTGWKEGSGKLISSVRKHKLEFSTPDAVVDRAGYLFGANFTPHVLTVKSGEDVNMKIMSFGQRGQKSICVLAANGAISNVTLRQLNSSGGTLTYEGRFDILSLSGSFTLNENGGPKGMSGGMTVSLAGPDGRVLGGGLAGMLLAAGSVQVILGSFVPSQQEQLTHKKSRFEHVSASAIAPPIIAAMPIFKEATERVYGDEPKTSFTLTKHTENNGSLHGSGPKFGVSY